MLFELKSVFQNEGEEKTISYKLDISNIDIDGVFPFKTPLDITATAGNRASLVDLTLLVSFDYVRSCDRCGEEFTRKMKYKFTHKLARTLETDGNDDYIETPDFVLDLDETVISDVLLSLPQKNLCKEDCKDCAVSAVIILMRVNAIAIKSRLTQGSRFLNNLWIDICYCKEVFVMAVPKRKTSHARKSSRRSTVWKLNAPTLVICPNCGEYKAAHRACGNCGMYNGRQVIVKANEN